MNEEFGAGFRFGGDLRFWGWERFAGMKGPRGRPAGEWGDIFAGCCRFRHDERNMETTSRGLRRAVEPVRRINPAGSAGDSVAHSALSRFRTARSGCLSSRRLRKSMVLWALFHVKHHPDRPHSVPFQCAPETLPEASTTASVRQTFVCARVRPHFGDQAGLALCSGSFRPQSERARGDRSIYRLKNRAALPFQR